MKAPSYIETHPDRDTIDADIRAIGTPGGSTFKEVATRWGIGIPMVQRRKRTLERLDAKPAPEPAPARATVAKSSDPEIQVPAVPAITVLTDTPDQDEAANNDSHIHRLRMVQFFRFRGAKNTEIATAMNRSLRTIERWVAAARKLRAVALTNIDVGMEYVETLAYLDHSRAQYLKNADACRSAGDLAGQRAAIAAADRAMAFRADTIGRMVDLGILQPRRSATTINEEAMRETGGETYRRIMLPILEEVERQARRNVAAEQAAPSDQPKETTS
jgi:transposase